MGSTSSLPLQHIQFKKKKKKKQLQSSLREGVPGGCTGAGEGSRGSMWTQAGAPRGWFAWEQGPLGPVLGNVGAQKLPPLRPSPLWRAAGLSGSWGWSP